MRVRSAPAPVPFTFAVPLISRHGARDWERVEALFGLTLASIFGQSDQEFRIIVAGHDRPRNLPSDPRITFLQVDWPADAPRADNLDAGRKKFAANAFVAERGGGLLMFVDADDWVDSRLVETARALIGPRHVGGLVTAGYALDFRSLRAAPLPHPGVFEGGFHRLCGSSAVVCLRPDDSDPLRRDPYAVLHDHHRWLETAAEHDAEILRLPVEGAYLVGTSENHSETHGPFAGWRREFTEAVNREGRAIDAAFAARFGLRLDRIRAASQQFFAPAG